MSWLVDHANLVYLLLGIVALGYVAAFWLTQRVKYLGYAGGVVVLMGLFWLLTRGIPTDRRQIEANVRTMADALVAGDEATLFKFVAKDFRYKTMDRKTLEERVRAALKFHQINDIKTWNFQFPEVARDAGKAKAEFNVRGSGPLGEVFYYFRTDFVLENNVWKIRSFEVMNPVVNQTIDLPL